MTMTLRLPAPLEPHRNARLPLKAATSQVLDAPAPNRQPLQAQEGGSNDWLSYAFMAAMLACTFLV